MNYRVELSPLEAPARVRIAFGPERPTDSKQPD